MSNPPEHDDEELEIDEEGGSLELPPIDADEALPEDEDDVEDLLEPVDAPDDPLDDAAASELETGLDIELEDHGAQGEDEPVEDAIDVGPLEEGLIAEDDGQRWLGDDVEGSGDLGEEIDDDGRVHQDDGAEGTGEAPEDDVDESALPALDADEEGTYEGEDLLAELQELQDDRPPVWDPSPWTALAEAGASVPCGLLAVSGGRVVAAGGGRPRRADERGPALRGVILLVEPGAHAAKRSGMDLAASSIALADGAIVIATRRGHILRSDDGATTTALGAWGPGEKALVTLATTPGRLWILCEGTLWSLPMDAAPASPAAMRDRGVLRVAASGGTLVALTSTPSGPRIERLRGDDEGAPSVLLTGAARQAAQAADGQLAAAAGGQAVAVSGEGALCVSRDGGRAFRAIAGLHSVLALCFAGDAEGAPLLALVDGGPSIAPEGQVRAQLIQVPESGLATIVAEIEAPAPIEEPASIGPAALVWDASRELAWVACRAGLVALARARPH